MKRDLLIAIGLVLVVGGTIAFFSWPHSEEDAAANLEGGVGDEEKRRNLDLEAGSQVNFAFSSRANLALTKSDAIKKLQAEFSDTAAAAEGVFQVKVLEERESSWALQASLWLHHEQASGQLLRIENIPIVIRKDGQILWPTDQVSRENRALQALRGAIETLSYRNNAATGGKDVSEEDQVGTFQARYTSRSGGKVLKRWVRYASLKPQGVERIANVDCRVEYSFDPEDAWVDRAEATFKRKFIAKDGDNFIEDSTITIWRTDDLPSRLSQLRTQADTAIKNAAKVASEVLTWQEAFERSMQELSKGGDEEEAFERIKRALGDDEKACREYLDLIIQLEAEGKIDERSIHPFWLYFARVGTPAAQRVLLSIISDESKPIEARVHALLYSGKIHNATKESIETLFGLRDKYRGRNEEFESLASSTSLLSAGILISEREPREGDCEVLAYQLQVELERAADAPEKRLVLDALGNAVHPSNLPAIEEHCFDANVQVQTSAIDALRGFPDATKLEVAKRLLPSLEKPPARAALVRSLADDGSDAKINDDLTDFAINSLAEERDPVVASKLVTLLGRAPKTRRSSEVDPLLKALYKSQPHMEVRKAILGVLGVDGVR